MRILDRYVTWRVVSSYLFISSMFLGLYFVIDLFSSLGDIMEAKTPLPILGEYYLNSLPLMVLRISPFALLIGTLYTFGDLNKYNEIISLRSSGLNATRIAIPVITFSLLISTALLFMQEKVLIHSQKRVEDIKSEFIKQKTISSEVEKLAFVSDDMIFFVQLYMPEEKLMKNVIIFKEDKNGRISKKTVCGSIAYEYGFWIAKDVMEYSLDESGRVGSEALMLSTKKIPLDEKPKDLLLKKGFLAQFSSLHDLRKRINSIKRIGESKQLSDLIVDYHQKIVEPFTSFFIIMGILPLALEIKKRKAALSALGVGFIFSLIYYAIYAFSIALGKSGILLPVFSAWLAPLFFLTVGSTGLLLTK
jgi:lipopolysaccharide export system permease protein